MLLFWSHQEGGGNDVVVTAFSSEFFKGRMRDASFVKGTITDATYGKGKIRDAGYGKGGLE